MKSTTTFRFNAPQALTLPIPIDLQGIPRICLPSTEKKLTRIYIWQIYWAGFGHFIESGPRFEFRYHEKVILGEFFNFAAYAFAPAILVTPLGALTVLIGAVLGSYLLKEELGTLGKLGCAICLLGALIIVLHAPPDEAVDTVDQILDYALRPGFLLYSVVVAIFTVVMIYKVAPVHGKSNPLIYLSICSAVGSVSVMSIKAFGIALKITFAGNNQFTHASTYVFLILTAGCILTQMNYFNKALSQFSTQIVNPLYYVTFTTATLVASFILFSGFNTTDVVGTLSLLAGFLITFTGVYLLNLSRRDPDGTKMLAGQGTDVTGTDMISSIQTRLSMQSRRSQDPRSSLGSRGHSDRDGLMRAYDEEQAHGNFGLPDTVDDVDTLRAQNGMNGHVPRAYETIEMENRN
ncbi:hypothetical protein EKO27_g2978 [Xylaria grammica]|uniref:DUF803 domain membrane protein n=1 Tax=Xylaria grammica TaxID=363999 RepID=A0A439DCM0_9PEZI|nr:hypothetical protein EKO27_g2978 [Xylaria grammica]